MPIAYNVYYFETLLQTFAPFKTRKFLFCKHTKMASTPWPLRGELHELETLLEGIRFQFSANYSLVTPEIWTTIAFAETPWLSCTSNERM